MVWKTPFLVRRAGPSVDARRTCSRERHDGHDAERSPANTSHNESRSAAEIDIQGCMYWALEHVACTSNTKYGRSTSTTCYSVLNDTLYK